MNRPRRERAKRKALDQAALGELAIFYVGRFATSRAKLRAYLRRKIHERGWYGAGEPDLDAIAERLATQGFIDDAGYALGKAQGLTARGFGKRRVIDTLRSAGIEEEDSAEARAFADTETVGAALRFARRRRIGPFAAEAPEEPKARDKAIAAMVRAGHSFEMARTIIALPPGAEVDVAALAERLHLPTA